MLESLNKDRNETNKEVSVSYCNSVIYSLAFLIFILVGSNGYASIADPYFKTASGAFDIAQKEATQTTSKNTYPLTKFTTDMPKGGDLHDHFTGAIYPSQLIGYAKNDAAAPSWCAKKVSPGSVTYRVDIDNNCIADGGQLLHNISTGDPLYQALLKSWSMYDFNLMPPRYGHDHFFSVFSEENALTHYATYRAEMLADLMRQAYKEHIDYLELMVKPDDSSSNTSSDAFAKDYLQNFPSNPTPANINNAITTLANHNFTKAVVDGNIISAVESLRSQAYTLLHCYTPLAEPACGIVVRFQYEAIRTSSLNVTFANLYAGFLATQLYPDDFVGVNLVAPEDNPVSLQEYVPQMNIIGDLHYLYPNVPISLHAGELTQQFVSPQTLSFHIYDALSLAHANRIGHGVDVWSEENAGHHDFSLMKQDNNLVEINLSSNEAILGVCDGESYCTNPAVKGTYNHPFYDYLTKGVPVALSTDDQGILLTDLNNEYYKASQRYPISYEMLKNIDRNSLAYSFIFGNDLWNNKYHGYPEWNYSDFVPACAGDNPYTNPIPSETCQNYLASNPKARLEWNLEVKFSNFEKLQT